MPSPEISSSLIPEVPEGAIFLLSDNLTVSEIESKLGQLYFCRGELGDIDPNTKSEIAAQLNSQRLRLADLAIGAL